MQEWSLAKNFIYHFTHFIGHGLAYVCGFLTMCMASVVNISLFNINDNHLINKALFMFGCSVFIYQFTQIVFEMMIDKLWRAKIWIKKEYRA